MLLYAGRKKIVVGLKKNGISPIYTIEDSAIL
jgi:hypothetical protein